MFLRALLLSFCLLGSSIHAAEVLGLAPPGSDPRVENHSRILANRLTTALREDARRKAGFPPATQNSVDASLRFLASQQGKDGSWGDRAKVATTAFALLAFLGNGETPLSEQHGEAITNGILFLVDSASAGQGRLISRRTGRPAPDWPLGHALGTQALSESLLVCSRIGVTIPGLERSVQNGTQWIIDHQHQRGGWAYEFSENSTRGSDDRITVPALHALWLAQRTRIETRNLNGSVRKTFALLEKVQTANGAIQFPVLANRPEAPMTGGCVFAFQIASQGARPVPRKAITFVANRDQGEFRYPASNLHALHYDALALWLHGDKPWTAWKDTRIPELLKHQEPNGSFAPQSDQPTRYPKDATLQRSSLACLILETPWRYKLTP